MNDSATSLSILLLHFAEFITMLVVELNCYTAAII